MRMDRYEENTNKKDEKNTRTNKNQELYADVYLNNVYVDINNLKEVMKKENAIEKENIKIKKEEKVINYNYVDKNYDIVSIIDEAIKNKKDDNLKRNIDLEKDEEIKSLIESIEENNEIKETEKELLSDLLSSDDNTSINLTLKEPILDSKIELNEEKIDKIEDNSLKDLEEDDSFIEKNNSKTKIIIIIFIILIIITLIIGVLLFKNII